MFNRIELLPADLQKQVLDFIDFLILKYRLPNMEEDELTPEQKEELLRIWEEYEQNPDDVLTLEEAMEQTKARYGNCHLLDQVPQE